MTDTIDSLRDEIDRTDTEIVRLICRRMALCEVIGRLKAERALPVYVPEREAAVQARLSSIAGKKYAGDIRTVYELIFALSRKHQEE